MKLSSKPLDPLFIGSYITMGTSQDEKVHVEIAEVRRYATTIHITFPPQLKASKAPFLRTAINRVGKGSSFPVRFDYANAVEHVSMAELTLLENDMKYAAFYIYRVPGDILPELTSSLDVHSIQNKIRRMADREKRMQQMKNRAVSAS